MVADGRDGPAPLMARAVDWPTRPTGWTNSSSPDASEAADVWTSSPGKEKSEETSSTRGDSQGNTEEERSRVGDPSGGWERGEEVRGTDGVTGGSLYRGCLGQGMSISRLGETDVESSVAASIKATGDFSWRSSARDLGRVDVNVSRSEKDVSSFASSSPDPLRAILLY